jgi:hypothetical protein
MPEGKLGLCQFCHGLCCNNLEQSLQVPGTVQVQLQSMIIGASEKRTMLEKLLLAITITFSLCLFLHVRLPNQTKTGANYRHPIETLPHLFVTTIQESQGTLIGKQ